MLALALGCAAAYAQEACTEGCCGGAEKRTEKIARICKLDEAQTAQVLLLTEKKCRQMIETKRTYSEGSKQFKKGMRVADKTYEKALRKLIGGKKYRILKGCDKVEQKAIAVAEKQKSKQSK